MKQNQTTTGAARAKGKLYFVEVVFKDLQSHPRIVIRKCRERNFLDAHKTALDVACEQAGPTEMIHSLKVGEFKRLNTNEYR